MSLDLELDTLESEAPAVAPSDARESKATPARSNGLVRDSTRLLIANVVYAASQWGLLAILARVGTTEMVGEWIYAISVTTPVMALCMLHLQRVQVTDARESFQFRDYLQLRLYGMACAALAVALIGVVLGFNRATIAIVGATAAIAIIDGISDVYYGFLQHRDRLDLVARSKIAKGLLSVAAFLIGILAGGWFFYGMTAIVFVRATIFLAFDRRHTRTIQIAEQAYGRFAVEESSSISRTQHLRKLFELALPLGLVMMLIALCGNIPRYFLERFLDEQDLGKSALGIFGAIGYLNVAGTLVIGSLGESSNVRLARDYDAGRKNAFAALTGRMVALAGGLGICGVLCAIFLGEWTLNLLYGSSYAAESAVLIWVMVAAGFGYVSSILGYVISAARYFRSQLPLFCCVASITAVASWYLVGIYGLHGAAYALVASSVAQLIGTSLIFRHALGRLTNAQNVAAPHSALSGA